jgi:ferric-dicitrate binding protein FerR (iron transport regulator)
MITDELLFRYLNRETNKKENRLVKDWLSDHPDQIKRLNELEKFYEFADQSAYQEESLRQWEIIESEIKLKHTLIPMQPNLLVSMIRIAAVLIVVAGSGLLWHYLSNNHTIRNRDLYAKSIFLPDGTQVDLGPGSKLVYGRGFSKGTREVRLAGEAFFSVVSDVDHPFTVIAGLTRIKVTGTKFVVNASPRGKEVAVSVKSGTVLFYNSDSLDKNSYRMGLVSGEKGIFYSDLNRMDKTTDPYFHSVP